jgi:hypothetical protein
MKDIHTERPKAAPIPILSPVMHCIAMTALVYLRRNFGFAFLRPKSVFFAFSWAFTLFVVFAWNEPQIWQQYRAVCIFGMGAVVLYWLCLLHTFTKEIVRHGENDHYSGRSHILLFVERFGVPLEKAELWVHLWIEPAVIVLASLVLRFAFSETHLSMWLLVVAVSLTATEYLNFWFGNIRRQKVAKDIASDAQAQGDELGGCLTALSVPKATRKEPIKIKRTIG